MKENPWYIQYMDTNCVFQCAPNELTNGVINACFLLMFKDLIRLFACYNDGIINLLGMSPSGQRSITFFGNDNLRFYSIKTFQFHSIVLIFFPTLIEYFTLAK